MPRQERKNQLPGIYEGIDEVKEAGINKDLNVGVRGFEPPTSASRTLRANQLRYTP